MEIWKQLDDFVLYEASNKGRIRHQSGKLLTLHTNHKSGYIFVRLYNNKKLISKAVAPLIAKTFLGPKPIGLQVDHKNEIKSDNNITNLSYITQSQNIIKRQDNIEHQNRHEKIKKLWATGQYSQVQISKIVGCNNSTVSRLLNKKSLNSKLIDWLLKQNYITQDQINQFLSENF